MKQMQIYIWVVVVGGIACWMGKVEGQCDNNGTTGTCTTPGFYNLASFTNTYYSFHSSNPALDYSGNGRTLTVPANRLAPTTNCTIASEGPGGNWASGCAWSDGGTRDIVNSRFYQMPSMSFPVAMSICLWIRPTSTTSASSEKFFYFAPVSGGANRLQLWRPGPGSIISVVYSGTDGVKITPEPSISTSTIGNTWMHICVVISFGLNNSGLIYTNGVFDSMFTPPAFNFEELKTQNWLFTDSTGTQRIYAGSMDEFRIYNRALSAIEVSAVFNYRGSGLDGNLWVSCNNTCSGTQVKRCNINGITVCVLPGFWFNDLSNLTTPVACPIGTYDALNGVGRNMTESCLTCSGSCSVNQVKHCSSAGAMVCVNPGWWFSGTAAVACAVGTFDSQNASGLSVAACSACAYGFSSAAGATGCFLLPGTMRITSQGGPVLTSTCPAGTFTGTSLNVNALTVTAFGSVTAATGSPAFAYDGLIEPDTLAVFLNSAGGTPQAWYDLGTLQNIQTVVIWARLQDCRRTNGFQFWVGNTSTPFDAPGNVRCFINTVGVNDATCSLQRPLPFVCNTTGRFAIFVLQASIGPSFNELAITNASCTPCAPGTFLPFDNMKFPTSCIPCETGTFQSLSGQTSCITCPTGMISASGASVCVSTVGWYNLANFTHSYYSFHPNNILADYSGNGRTLTLQSVMPTGNCSNAVDGPGGNWASNCISSNTGAFRAEATSTSLNMPNFVITSRFTICIWARAFLFEGPSSAFCLGTGALTNAIDFAWGTTMNMQWAVTAGNIQPNSFSSPLEWNHYCIGGTDTNVSTYFNGQLRSSFVPNNINLDSTKTTTRLLASCAGSGRVFTGSIDDFRVYNRVLSASEVTAVYNYRGSGLNANIWVSCANTCSAGQTKRCSSNGDTVCVSPGYWYPGSTSANTWPTPCPDNTFDSLNGTGSNASVCVACPVGLVADTGSASCFNPDGWYNLADSTYTYYSFHPSNPLLDNSGNGRNLTIPASAIQPPTQCTSASSGPGGNWLSYCLRSNGGLVTDSSPQYLAFPNIFLPPAVTICWWWRSETYVGFQRLWKLSGTGFYTETYRSNVGLFFNIWWGPLLTYSLGGLTWFHMCMTNSIEPGFVPKIYLNGVEQGTVIASFNHFPENAKSGYLFGIDHLNNLFQGSLEDFRIYNRALTPTGIQAVYNYKGTGLTSTLWVSCPNTCLSNQNKYCNRNGVTICVGPGFWFEGHTSNLTYPVPCPENTFDTRNGAGRNASACSPCATGLVSDVGSTSCFDPIGWYNLADSTHTYYSFHPSNPLLDNSGNGRTLTVPANRLQPSTNCTTDSQGPGGNWTSYCAYSPGGTKNVANTRYFQMPDMFIPPALSICVWLRPDLQDSVNYERIYAIGEGVSLNSLEFARRTASPANRIQFCFSKSTFCDSIFHVLDATLSANVWRHVCFTNTMGSIDGKLYVDGINVNANLSTLVDLNIATNKISNWLFTGQFSSAVIFQGSIDDFRIYNRVLSQPAITAIYNYRGVGLSSTIWISCNNTCTSNQVKRCNINSVTVCVSPGFWFNDKTTGTTPTACPIGTYDALQGRGQSSQAACLACPDGEYTDIPAAFSCQSCFI